MQSLIQSDNSYHFLRKSQDFMLQLTTVFPCNTEYAAYGIMKSCSTSRSSSPTPSLKNQLQPDGTWTIRLDDQYIDEEKLPYRLKRIFSEDIDAKWESNQWVIRDAPRKFLEVSGHDTKIGKNHANRYRMN